MIDFDNFGEIGINISFPLNHHWYVVEIDLEKELKEHYHSDCVFIGGTGTDFKTRDIHVVISGKCKELETTPKTFIKEVVLLARKTIRESCNSKLRLDGDPILVNADINVTVYPQKWKDAPKGFHSSYTIG